MTDNSNSQNSNDRNKHTESSSDSFDEAVLNTSGKLGNVDEQQDDPKAESSANEQDNQEQPNLAADKADKNRNIASGIHDNFRQTPGRANEANDRLDTGSGGLSSGGVKSATDL
jgi:hypothetical protein